MNIITRIWHRAMSIIVKVKYRKVAHSAFIDHRVLVYNKQNIILEECTNIDAGAVIMNTRAKFIMKKWSGAAIGLLAVTGNHMQVVGKNLKQVTNKMKDELDTNHELDKDIVIEEDVWIASNVTLLSGVRIGRGGIVGASSVVRKSTPPYAIVAGNPSKVIGFRFSPEEIIEHEKVLYPKDKRLPVDMLTRNYNKYFANRIPEIRKYINL